MQWFGFYEFCQELLSKGLDQFEFQNINGQIRTADY